MEKKLTVDICVCAYNEEANIANILEALLNQRTEVVKLKEIVVVSSASTDKTDKIVSEYSKKNKEVKLIRQKTREGKAAAINEFLKQTKSDFVVLESGDTIPSYNTIEELCKPMVENEKVGMTGCRSIPSNKKDHMLGYIIHFWWWVASKLPRYGEIIAFRNIVPWMDPKTSVDEAWIETKIQQKGYILEFVHTTFIKNKGADNLNDLLKQRRRVYVGHTHLRKYESYKVTSFNFLDIFKYAMEFWKKSGSLKHFIWLIEGALIEIYGRFLGAYDMYIKRKNPYKWDIATTTKKLK